MTTRPSLDPWTGTFRAREHEDAYLRETHPSLLRRARAGVVVFGVGWLAWAARDVTAAPDAWPALVAVRSLALAPLVGVAFVRPPSDPRRLQLALAVGAGVLALVVNVPGMMYANAEDQILAARMAIVVAATAWMCLRIEGLVVVNLLTTSTGVALWAVRTGAAPAAVLTAAAFLGVAVAGAALLHALASGLMRDRQAALWEVGDHVRVREDLVETLARELHKPLTSARMHARLAREHPEAAPRFLRHLDLDLERATERVASVLRLGRVHTEGVLDSEIPLSDLLADVRARLAERTQPVGLETILERDGAVAGDSLLLCDALVTLHVHALQRARSRVLVRARVEDGRTTVALHDDGDPPNAHASPKGRRPTPFGLAMAERIAQAHGGQVHVGPGELGGSCVTITLRALRAERTRP